ncbi:MAG: translocation/assembly module TamB domain-containing protein, partial [Bacteroidia bacterium]|nr:translocation/assembly module TamB domain-containing protein [Bacteroidia bacterium]
MVRCQNDKIVFKDVALENPDPETGRAEANRYAVADGTIDLKNFEDLAYEIEFKDLRRFRLMATTPRDNEMFYGKVYLNGGTAKIRGDLNRLSVEGAVVAGAGTNVGIPVAHYAKSSRPDFVTFVAPLSPQKSVRAPQKTSSSFAFELNLDVTATPEATVNLVFDEAAGDKITANGTGNLHLGLNADGDFRIEGFYEIASGKYNFNFRNVINKRFSIDPGSTLSWSGDPLDARMDIRAVYRAQQASVKAWDTTQTSGVTIDVVMNIKGSLSAPEISYGLQFPALARQQAGGSIGSNILAANLRLVESDPQELNRQVFSLIMFDALAPIGSFFGRSAAGEGVSTGLSDFVSAQLNQWIAGTLDQKIGVNFGYAQDQVIMNLRA